MGNANPIVVVEGVPQFESGPSEAMKLIGRPMQPVSAYRLLMHAPEDSSEFSGGLRESLDQIAHLKPGEPVPDSLGVLFGGEDRIQLTEAAESPGARVYYLGIGDVHAVVVLVPDQDPVFSLSNYASTERRMIEGELSVQRAYWLAMDAAITSVEGEGDFKLPHPRV